MISSIVSHEQLKPSRTQTSSAVDHSKWRVCKLFHSQGPGDYEREQRPSLDQRDKRLAWEDMSQGPPSGVCLKVQDARDRRH